MSKLKISWQVYRYRKSSVGKNSGFGPLVDVTGSIGKTSIQKFYEHVDVSKI